jgi:para-aminobenzoate synthetase/4-amino-4-deoxychorismate lyase
MEASAAHFGYPWDAAQAHAACRIAGTAHAAGRSGVCACCWRTGGKFSAQAYALPASPARVRLQLAGRPLDETHGEFVRFKTTRRAHYDAFTPTEPEVFDTVLWNAEGELTECTRGNMAMRVDGRWVTPPLRCGLLAGVGRALALQEGRLSEASCGWTNWQA